MGGLSDIQAANNAKPAAAATGYQTLAQAQAAADAANKAAIAAGQKPVGDADYAQLISDLNSGNYGGAWGYASGFGNAVANQEAGVNPMYGVNNFANNGVTGSSQYTLNPGTMQANPLIEDLINGSSLNTLDPSLNWSQAQEDAFYSAATPYYNPDLLGTNPSGQWGDPTKLAADGTTNYNAGYNPNFEQFAGAVPKEGFLDKAGDIVDTYGPSLIAAAATAGAAAPLGAALGLGSGALASGVGGALVGAGTGALNAAGQGGNIGQSALLGGITGGLGGASSGLINGASEGIGDFTGLSGSITDPLAAGLVKGGIGAAVGAGGAALTGNNVSNGAITGGASGAASGAVGNLTGSPIAGGIAGTIAGAGAGTLLNNATGNQPATGGGTPAQTSTALQALPTDPNAGPTNIGSYSGYGYAPRQQIQNPVSNYATYGQGPEANFFSPLTPASAPANANTPVPVPTTIDQTQPNLGMQQFYPAMTPSVPASSSTIQNPTSFVGGNL